MTTSGRVRDERRAASEAGILDAAWELFARNGPDGASFHAVAAAAGCTHALVTRYYGSKAGLEAAVASQLADRVDRSVSRSIAVADDPLADVLASARAHRTSVQLLVRSALGDLPSEGLSRLSPRRRAAGPGAGLLRSGCTHRPRRPTRPDRRVRSGEPAARLHDVRGLPGAAATGLGPLAPRRRDSAMTSAAKWLLEVAGRPKPRLEPRDLRGRAGASPTADRRPGRARGAAEIRHRALRPTGACLGVGARRRTARPREPGPDLPALRLEGRAAR